MKNNSKLRMLLNSIVSGMLFGILVVGGIIVLKAEPSLMLFFGSSMVSIMIFMANLYVSKLSDKSDTKIEEILGRVKRIEERLDGLYKK